MKNIKFIAELITSVATACVVIINLSKIIPSPIKIFLTGSIPLFFKGFTNQDGTKTRFFKGLRLKHEYNETTKRIAKVLISNSEMEDILVLDKAALLNIISESKAFYKIRNRK
jgi:hypothetical protein